MKRLLFAFVFLSVCQSHAASLVGQTVPPYPAGFSSKWGSCIADRGDICAYSIATLHDAAGDVIGVLGKKLVRGGSDPRSRILDQMPAPRLQPGQLWATEECRVRGREDSAAIGIVTYKDKGGWLETLDTVWAVRFDTQSKALVELDPETTRCILPGS
jgi:hypothetical protein